MKLLLVFFIFCLGFLFSKVNINIKNIDISLSNYNLKKIKIDDFETEIKIYLYVIIRIISIKIYKDCIVFNGFKINKKIVRIVENEKKIISLILKNKSLIADKIQNINLELKYSTSDSSFTAIVYSLICIITNNLLSRGKITNKANIEINPFFYNTDIIRLSFNCVFIFSLKQLLELRKQIV